MDGEIQASDAACSSLGSSPRDLTSKGTADKNLRTSQCEWSWSWLGNGSSTASDTALGGDLRKGQGYTLQWAWALKDSLCWFPFKKAVELCNPLTNVSLQNVSLMPIFPALLAQKSVVSSFHLDV